jgi:hypothetical protein
MTTTLLLRLALLMRGRMLFPAEAVTGGCYASSATAHLYRRIGLV